MGAIHVMELTTNRDRMLIADANDRMRLLLRSTLSDLEAEILEARTSESALECVRTHRPEWVMLEFNLRPLNGRADASKHPIKRRRLERRTELRSSPAAIRRWRSETFNEQPKNAQESLVGFLSDENKLQNRQYLPCTLRISV